MKITKAAAIAVAIFALAGCAKKQIAPRVQPVQPVQPMFNTDGTYNSLYFGLYVRMECDRVKWRYWNELRKGFLPADFDHWESADQIKRDAQFVFEKACYKGAADKMAGKPSAYIQKKEDTKKRWAEARKQKTPTSKDPFFQAFDVLHDEAYGRGWLTGSKPGANK